MTNNRKITYTYNYIYITIYNITKRSNGWEALIQPQTLTSLKFFYLLMWFDIWSQLWAKGVTGDFSHDQHWMQNHGHLIVGPRTLDGRGKNITFLPFRGVLGGFEGAITSCLCAFHFCAFIWLRAYMGIPQLVFSAATLQFGCCYVTCSFCCYVATGLLKSWKKTMDSQWTKENNSGLISPKYG
jgi:hypothetical protein